MGLVRAKVFGIGGSGVPKARVVPTYPLASECSGLRYVVLGAPPCTSGICAEYEWNGDCQRLSSYAPEQLGISASKTRALRRLEQHVERMLLLRAGQPLAWQRRELHPERAQDPIPPEERQLRAPDGLFFELGLRPGASPLARWRSGDIAVSTGPGAESLPVPLPRRTRIRSPARWARSGALTPPGPCLAICS